MLNISVGQGWMWAGFIALILVLLFIDLLWVGGGKEQRISAKKALVLTLVWIAIALLFNLALWWYLQVASGNLALANQKATEFFTGYLIEKALSIDNIFVFLLVFRHFSVPMEYQRRVLLYGILGAIMMRAVVIFAGAWLINQFEWLLYVFGAILAGTGIKMFFTKKEADLSQNKSLTWLAQRFRVTHTLHGQHFFQRIDGLWYITPLFLALILIEISDLIFALDSIPAIFAITRDPFIVFTSNVFAILGLRALYFLLADMADRFSLLKYGLAAVLVFIGMKMLLEHWLPIPTGIALMTVALIIATSILASLWLTVKNLPDKKLTS